MHNQFNLALKKNNLFKDTNISSISLEELNLRVFSLDEGEILFKNDDQTNSIFLVLEGEINLLRRQNFSKTTTTILSPNEFFGQDEFFNNTKRTSTALAIRNTKLAELTKENLDTLLVRCNGLFNNLKDSLVDTDEKIVENLEKLLNEAKYKFENDNSKASIFNLNSTEDSDLKSINYNKKNEKVIQELNDKITNYNDLIRKKELKITTLYDRLDEYQNSHKQLTSMMDNQNEQLSRLLGLENSYKEQIKIQTERISVLEEKIKDSSGLNPQLDEIIAIKDDEIRKLRDEIQLHSADYDKIENKTAEFISKIKDYEKQIANLDLKLQKSVNSEEVSKFENQINSLLEKEKDYTSTKKELMESQQEIEILNGKIDELIAKNTNLEEKERELTLALETNELSESEVSSLKEKIIALEKSSSEYSRQIEESKYKNEDLLKKISEYENQIKEFRSNNSSQILQIEKLSYIENNFKKLESEKNAVINNLNGKINQLEDKYKNYEEEKTVILDKIERQIKEISDLQEVNNKLKSADKYKNDLIGDQSYKIAQLQEKESALNEIQLKYNDLVSSYESQIAVEHSKYESASSFSKSLEKENYELQAKIAIERDEIVKFKGIESELRKAAEHKSEIIQKQKGHIEELKAKENFLKQADVKKQEIIERQQNRINELETNDNDKENLLKELANNVKNLQETEIYNLSQLTQLQSEVKISKENEEKIKNEKKLLSDLNEKLQIQSSELNSQILKLNSSVNKKNEIIENQSEHVKKIENEKSELKKIADEKNEIIIKQSHKITEVEHNAEELKHKISQHTEVQLDLKNSNKYLNEKLEELKVQFDSINEENESNKKIAEERTELLSLGESKISELDAKLSKLEGENQKINSELEEKGILISNYEKTEKDLKVQIDEKNNDLSSVKSVIKDLEVKQNEYLEINSELEKELQNVMSDKDILSNSVQELAFKNEQQIELVNNLENQNSEKTKRIEDLEGSFAQLNDQLQEKELKIASLRSHESELTEENYRIKDQIETTKIENEKIKSEFSSISDNNNLLNNQILELKGNILERTKSEQLLITERDEKQKTISHLESELRTVREELSMVSAEYSQHEFRINELSNSLVTAEEKYSKKSEELNYLRVEFETKSTQVSEFELMVNQQKTDIDSLKNSENQKAEQIVELNLVLKEKENHISDLNNELHFKTSEISELQIDSQNTNNQIEEYKSRIVELEKLKQSLHEANEKENSVSLQLAELHKNYTTEVQKKEHVLDLLNNVENEKLRLEKHISTLEKNIVERDRTIEELHSDISVEKSEIEKRLSEKIRISEELQKSVIALEEQLEIAQKGFNEASSAQESELQYVLGQLEESNKEIENGNSTIDELNARIQSVEELSAVKIELEKKTIELQDQIEHISLDISIKNEENKHVVEENHLLKSRLSDLEEKISKSEIDKVSSEETINALGRDLQDLKSRIESDKEQIEQKSIEISKISEELNVAISERETALQNQVILAETIEKLESSLLEERERKQTYDIELNNQSELEETVKVLQSEIENLSSQLHGLESTIGEKNSIITDLTKKIEFAEGKRSDAISSSDNLLSLNEALEVELVELKELKKKYEKDLAQKDSVIINFSTQLENAKRDASSNEVVEEYEQRIRILEDEIEKTKNSTSDQSAILGEKNSIIEEQGKRLAQVKLEKTEKEIEFIKLKEQVEDYKNEIEKLNSSKNNYMIEANRGLEEAEMLTNQIEDIREKLAEKAVKEEEFTETIEKQLSKITELELELEKLNKFSKTVSAETSPSEIVNVDSDENEIDVFGSGDKSKVLIDNFESEDENSELDLSFSQFEESSQIEADLELEEVNEEEKELDGKKQDNNVKDIQKPESAIGEPELEAMITSNLPQFSEFAHLLYGNVSVVSINLPRATMDIASKFKEYLNALIESDNTKIVIDLSETEFVDSTVLGVLVSSLKKSMSKGGDVRIVWGDNTESSMFYITRMDKVFKLYDNLEDAVQSYL